MQELSMSGQVNDFALIKLVEAYPILYDKGQSRGQRNAELKDHAWRELSLKLNVSERACITRWKSIRDRFGKEYRRVQENPEEPTNWDIFPHLLFLRNHYKHGNASNDQIIEVKYEPKERKRKGHSYGSGNGSQQEDESNNEEELDPEELLINQQLIALVKEHPVLYDKCKIRDSKNITAKSDAWGDIADSLALTDEECYKRWKKLRDRFAREYRYKQISPCKPVMWVYFQDLMFLESHYRKGIPLNVETLKRKGKGHTEDNPWGSDYPSGCGSVTSLEGIEVHDEHTISDSMEDFVEIEEQALDELLMMSTKDEPASVIIDQVVVPEQNIVESLPDVPASIEQSAEIDEAEDKLHDVISNMETVLRQSKDALHALREQKQRHRSELEMNALYTQPSLMQKVHILLQGLTDGDRSKAEKKILRFLCECQIQSLNNEEIEDFKGVQIN